MKNKLKNMMKSDNIFIKTITNIGYKWFMRSKLVFFIRYRPLMNDKKYIRRTFKKRLNYDLNLDNPSTFNEKINWLKIYGYRDKYSDYVDKYKIKLITDKILGSNYYLPLIGKWDNAKEIDFGKMPSQFVLKTNNAGGIIVCYDKNEFNTKKAIKELNKLLKVDFSAKSRERIYSKVEKKIIAEPFIGDFLTEYKNYCFNGKVLYTFVWKNIPDSEGRKPKTIFCGAYDREWNRQDLELDWVTDYTIAEKPNKHSEMLFAAEKMSENIPFVRFDCFIKNNQVIIGEMTFYPWGGFLRFKSKKWDLKFGEQLFLNRKSKIKETN